MTGIKSCIFRLKYQQLFLKWNASQPAIRKVTSRPFTQDGIQDGLLQDVKILDLTRILAGPYCTMILADMGAKVFKIERPGLGDETRRWGPPFIGSESVYFMCVNRNKKSVCIDLKCEEGRDAVRLLASKCDVLVENYVPGKLSEMGLGYEDLVESNPRLIYCSITGFGPEGPYRNRPGYDVICAAMGGLLNITGPENGDPCKVGVAMTDLATGLYAHGAILAALFHRYKTGRGRKIDCDLLSTQVSCLANVGANFLNANIEAKRWGTAHQSIVPYQAFATSDGFLVVGGGSDAQFSKLCRAIGRDDLSADARYSTNESRVAHRSSLVAELAATFVRRPTREWLRALDGAAFPYGPINDMAGVFGDPQVRHRGLVVEVDHPRTGGVPVRLVGPPVMFDGDSSGNRRIDPPPWLGQHTDEVLRKELGLSDPEIHALRDKCVVG